jgi:hypothetical protein
MSCSKVGSVRLALYARCERDLFRRHTAALRFLYRDILEGADVRFVCLLFPLFDTHSARFIHTCRIVRRNRHPAGKLAVTLKRTAAWLMTETRSRRPRRRYLVVRTTPTTTTPYPRNPLIAWRVRHTSLPRRIPSSRSLRRFSRHIRRSRHSP